MQDASQAECKGAENVTMRVFRYLRIGLEDRYAAGALQDSARDRNRLIWIHKEDEEVRAFAPKHRDHSRFSGPKADSRQSAGTLHTRLLRVHRSGNRARGSL